MKKHKIQILIYNLGILIGLIILSSCNDLLDEKVWSKVAVKDFYTNQSEFEIALNDQYNSFRNIYTGSDSENVKQGDETTDIYELLGRRGVSQDGFDGWDWSSTGGSTMSWANLYNYISNVNRIIVELGNVELPEAFEKQIGGEARFFRAFYYYNLVITYYNVPIIAKPIDGVANDDMYKGRDPIEECWKFIEDDLIASVADLSPLDMAKHKQGRVTAVSAQALLARVYADQKKWAEASSAADKALGMPGIALEPDFKQIWNPDKEYTGEHLLSVSYAGNRKEFGYSELAFRHTASGWTHEIYGDILFSSDESQSWVNFQVPRKWYDSYPPQYRKTYSVRDWMPYYIKKSSGLRINDTITFPSGIAPTLVKYAVNLKPDNKTFRTDVNLIVIRTSEMYLIKAEALNELNGSTQVACDALNAVRRRARAVGTPMGEPASVYPDITTGVGKENFRDIVIEEFAREFVGEGLFREVLLRHGRYHTRAWAELKKDGVTPVVPLANQKIHKLYWNIPLEVREVNSNLTNYPGYETTGN